MAELKINELSGGRFAAGQRLYLDSSGETIVAESHPDSAVLFAAEGDEVSRDDAVRFGLVKPTAAEKKAAKADDEA